MARWLLILTLVLSALLVGCQSTGGQLSAVPYYQHRYPTARDIARPLAADSNSENVVLDNLRLGLASMADGDLDEAERALLRAYEYLISGGVNQPDRVISATILHEGTRVWKGEPYEQAMAFYYLAALYMMRGDWENARAAAANSLFALRDFEAADMGEIAEKAVRIDKRGGGDYLASGFRKIESQFTLGYLLAATNYVLMGQPEDARRMFEHVRQLRPDLAPLVDQLVANQYDALLLIDAGRGPRKQAYGPDDALIRYIPDGRQHEPMGLSLSMEGQALSTPGDKPIVDLWVLSQYPRWWSLEGMRKAKSAMGSVLLVGGLGAAAVGSQMDSDAAVYAGLGAMLAGAAMKATSKADERHLAMLPRSVFLVPITLGADRRDLSIRITGRSGAVATWHDLRGGQPGDPAVYYLRMHDGDGRGMPSWASQRLHSVAADQYTPGDRPWLLGGRDLTPPSDEIVEAYHRAGVLKRVLPGEWAEAVRGEGLYVRPGPQGMTGEAALDPLLYRHVTEQGRVLWTPRPGTHLYQRITRTEHPPYVPRGPALKRIMAAEQNRKLAVPESDQIISRPAPAEAN